MGLFDKLKKKEALPEAFNVADDKIVALADGELIDVSTVSDPMFAQKVMGDSIAFEYNQDKVVLCAPANGTLSVLFPTGHAFGLQMKNGVQLLVHCGVNTVETNGDGFRVLNKKQGDVVKAGEPIVEVNMKKLKPNYDMSTMLIITDAAGQDIQFKDPQTIKRGDSVIL
ncbi:MAG: PTS glucose transporter subunit IIA [Faecalicoccus sp.]|nr:PTS glucose transporter subunit IIA [Faecalicoccus sp.]